MSLCKRAILYCLVGGLIAAMLVWQFVEAQFTDPPRVAPTADATSEFLEPWYEKLAAAADESATVVVVGDSISESSTLSGDVLGERWTGKLQNLLRASVGVAGGPGFVAPYWGDRVSPESTVRSGPPSTEKFFGPWGLGGRALLMPGGSSIAYPPQAATRVRVGFGRSATVAGQAKVFIDGVDVTVRGSLDGRLNGDSPVAKGQRDADTSISSRGIVDAAGMWWTSPELDAGQHVVQVQSTSPGYVFVHTGVEYLMGDETSGIHVVDASQAGATTANFASDDAARGHWKEVEARDPDLVLINLGTNLDPRFEKNLETVVERALALGPDVQVMVVDGYEPGNWTSAEWDVEVSRARARVVARHSGRVHLFDLAAQWPRLAKDGSTSGGLMADTPPIHLTSRGNDRMAEIFASTLALPPGYMPRSG